MNKKSKNSYLNPQFVYELMSGNRSEEYTANFEESKVILNEFDSDTESHHLLEKSYIHKVNICCALSLKTEATEINRIDDTFDEIMEKITISTYHKNLYGLSSKKLEMGIVECAHLYQDMIVNSEQLKIRLGKTESRNNLTSDVNALIEAYSRIIIIFMIKAENYAKFYKTRN